jgi:hypothetical protein
MTAVPLHGLDGSVARITLQCHTYVPVHIGTSAYSTRDKKKSSFLFCIAPPLLPQFIFTHNTYSTIHTQARGVWEAHKDVAISAVVSQIRVRRMRWYNALSI